MPGASDQKPADLTEQVKWMASAALAAGQYGVRAVEIMDIRGAATRATGELLNARRAALYLASVGSNLSVRALMRATGMQKAAIRKHLWAIEDDREVKPRLDALLDKLTDDLQSGLRRAGGADVVADELTLRRQVEAERVAAGDRRLAVTVEAEVTALRQAYGLPRRTARLLWLLQAAPNGRLTWTEHRALFEARWTDDQVGCWKRERARLREKAGALLGSPLPVGIPTLSKLVPPRGATCTELTAAGLSAIRDLLSRRRAA